MPDAGDETMYHVNKVWALEEYQQNRGMDLKAVIWNSGDFYYPRGGFKE